MPEDEFRADLRWPTDSLGEREANRGEPYAVEHDEDVEPVTEVWTNEARSPVIASADRSSRFVVEAYDRLADRVLERLRVLRVDLDADLAEVRSEMASLRQAVDDVGDRVQLRQLRSSVDELRSDVAGLRRAVMEWPELERVSSDLAALRADMSALAEDRIGSRSPQEPDAALLAVIEEIGSSLRQLSEQARAAATSDEVATLHDSVDSLAGLMSPDLLTEVMARLREDMGAVVSELPHVELVATVDQLRAELHDRSRDGIAEEPLVSALSAIREELVLLRRRISLRASVDPPGHELSEEQLRAIAEAVTASLSRSFDRGGS